MYSSKRLRLAAVKAVKDLRLFTNKYFCGVALVMAVYLSISLGISLFMNWYNTRIALVER